MTEPITFDFPHRLGVAGAREKLEAGIGQIAGILPGGSLRSHRWEGDTLYFEIEALGQRVSTKLELFETRIHAVVDLSPMASLFADAIKMKLTRIGTKLLM